MCVCVRARLTINDQFVDGQTGVYVRVGADGFIEQIFPAEDGEQGEDAGEEEDDVEAGEDVSVSGDSGEFHHAELGK
jgi:hypothetical protein